MRLLINNLCNATNTTVNSENASFPKSEQYTNVLVEKTELSTYQDIDLGENPLLNAFGIQYEGSGNLTLTGGNTIGGSEFSLNITQDIHWLDTNGSIQENNLITGQGDNLITGQGDQIIVAESDSIGFRYWRLTTDATVYINYFYLGEYLQFPGVAEFPTPFEQNTDNINITSGGQIYTTQGITFKQYGIQMATNTAEELEAVVNWYRSSDRKNNHLLALFEDCIDTFPFEPVFVKLIGGIEPARDRFAFDYQLNFREGK